MMEAFNRLEKQYWDLYRPIFLEQYINPLNIAKEKENFSKAWKEDKQYNPQFQYKALDFNLEEKVDNFLSLKKTFEKNIHELSIYYIEHIEETIVALQHFSNREAKAFNVWLTAQYDRPSKQLVKQANKMLATLNLIVKEEQSVDASEVLEIFTQALRERNFSGWEISIEEMPARMSINQMLKKVKIKASAKFSSIEIERLIVHEIDTHILRAENAKKQPYLLFQYGFPKYLKTEEGLAILSEEKHGLLSQYDKEKYAMRVLAADYTCEHSFYELFSYLHQKLDFDDAFNMALRTKRGLVDSSQSGGYTKDQVYLDGYVTLKQESLDVISKLYYGKIGVENIDVLKNLDKLEENIIYPEWVK